MGRQTRENNRNACNSQISSAPMAATTNRANAFSVAKYFIWNTTVKINHATGMEIPISSKPTNARNQDPVLIWSHRKMKAKENIASMASFPAMLRMTSPIMDV